MDVSNGSPRVVSVRELIGLWGASGRGSRVVARVRTDLRSHGLTTDPDFRKVSLDHEVWLVPATERRPTIEPQPAPQVEEEATLAEDVRLTVGSLPSASAKVVFVNPNQSIREAYTLMLLNDFSQLAVLSGPVSLRGAVTWRSIAEALMKSGGASLKDSIIEAEAVRYDADLLEQIPRIIENDFVFVRDANNQIGGIVTSADLSKLFEERTRAFLLLGEIDQRLRRLLASRFTLGEVIALLDLPDGARSPTSFDELTMGEYQRVLSQDSNFDRLGWPLDRKIFIDLLDRVRQTRNDVMHFSPDPIDDTRMREIDSLADALRRHN